MNVRILIIVGVSTAFLVTRLYSIRWWGDRLIGKNWEGSSLGLIEELFLLLRGKSLKSSCIIADVAAEKFEPSNCGIPVKSLTTTQTVMPEDDLKLDVTEMWWCIMRLYGTLPKEIPVGEYCDRCNEPSTFLKFWTLQTGSETVDLKVDYDCVLYRLTQTSASSDQTPLGSAQLPIKRVPGLFLRR
jgi:hypothetical protein